MFEFISDYEDYGISSITQEFDCKRTTLVINRETITKMSDIELAKLFGVIAAKADFCSSIKNDMLFQVNNGYCLYNGSSSPITKIPNETIVLNKSAVAALRDEDDDCCGSLAGLDDDYCDADDSSDSPY